MNRVPEYCTQNNGDCATCSLTNYGRDCRNNPIQDDGADLDTALTQNFEDIEIDDE